MLPPSLLPSSDLDATIVSVYTSEGVCAGTGVVARRAHNSDFAGPNPTPATEFHVTKNPHCAQTFY